MKRRLTHGDGFAIPLPGWAQFGTTVTCPKFGEFGSSISLYTIEVRSFCAAASVEWLNVSRNVIGWVGSLYPGKLLNCVTGFLHAPAQKVALLINVSVTCAPGPGGVS